MIKKQIYLLSVLFICSFSFAQPPGWRPVKTKNPIAKKRQYLTPIPVSSKNLDIPRYEGVEDGKIPFVFWHFVKQKEKQLGLISPETSGNMEVFRTWFTIPKAKTNQTHALIELINDSTGWKGRLFLMRVDFSSKKLIETITKSTMIELQPLESDWLTLRDSLIFHNFDDLPTDEKIPDYYPPEGGYANNDITFLFEYANWNSYRFYQYNDIYRAYSRFPQPKNVEGILDLLQRNFNMDEKASEYFKAN